MNPRREIAFMLPQLSIMSASLFSWRDRSPDCVCDSFRGARLSGQDNAERSILAAK
jgi:hypothetical protein